MEDEFFDEGGFVGGVELEFGFEGDEGVDGLPGEFVCGAYDGGFGDAFVEDESGLDLGG